MLAPLLDHLWQSSLVAAGAALLTLAFLSNGARVRFWLWFAASLKFLLPFTVLAALGGWLARLYPHAIAAPAMIVPAIKLSAPARMLPAPATPDLAPILLGLWALGLAVVLGSRLLRWARLSALVAQAQELDAATPVKVMASSSLMEPGLVGVFRPVVLMPAGLLPHLAPGEMQSILAHEASHLARRDNLTAALHMLVEAVFWFWPPVWLIGARMIAERERACDESVLADGHDPEVYAGSILKVCKFCIQSPIACVPGMSGSHLGRRMVHIMAETRVRELNIHKQTLLLAAGLLTVSLPVMAGFVTSPFAVEVTRRAAAVQAQISAAAVRMVTAPLAHLAPQAEEFVPVVKAHRPVHRVAASEPPIVAGPAPSPVPAVAVSVQAPSVPAPAPFTIVPAAKPAVSADMARRMKDAPLALYPTGEGDPDAITCRVPQILPGSRLPGPEICQTNRAWAALRAERHEISPDGETVIATSANERNRSLRAMSCIAFTAGSATNAAAYSAQTFCN